MESDINPLNQDGLRNVFCPHYRRCLDRAVTGRWLFWSCAECVHRMDTELLTDGILTYTDALPFYTLPTRAHRIEG